MSCITSTWRGVTVCAHMVSDLDWIAAHVGNDITLQPIAGCGSYQTTTAASAGTHAGGGAIDFNLAPYTDAQARRVETVARSRLKLAYFRPAIKDLWQKHVHVLFSDCSALSASALKQFPQYEQGLNALANNGPDTGTRSYVTGTMRAFNSRFTISAITAGGFTVADINTITSQLNTLIGIVRSIATRDDQLLDSADGGYIVNKIDGVAKQSTTEATRLDAITKALTDLKAQVDALPKAPGA